MNHTVLIRESFQTSGLSVNLTDSQKENVELIQSLWQRLNAELRAQNIRFGKNWKKYGITCQKEGRYLYMASIPFNESCENFSTIQILGGTFACFQHIGAMNLLKNSYYNIYKKYLSKSNLLIDKNRPVLHYEVYDNRFNWNRNDSVIEIFIPLQG